MELYIDNIPITPEPGESLLTLIRRMNLDACCLSKRPIAAKIAGEVFNLNYIPVRASDGQKDRSSIRKAMAASGGVVQLLRYSDPSGKDVYSRTVQFILFLALHKLWPGVRTKTRSSWRARWKRRRWPAALIFWAVFLRWCKKAFLPVTAS